MNSDLKTRLLSSLAASAVAEAVTVPIDTVKVRLQVQHKLSTPSASAAATAGARSAATSATAKAIAGAAGVAPPTQYTGMANAFATIIRQEGVGGIFKGLAPAMLRQCSYTPLTMILYTPLRNAMGENPDYFRRLLAGGTAGGVAIAVMNPTEVLKTQLQASHAKRLRMRDVVRNVWATEGAVGFWAGVKPNIARTFLVNAAELGTYDQAKHFLVAIGWVRDGSLLQHVSASGLAGLCSALISTPADVVKTRLMNQTGHQHEYTGAVNALTTIFRREGFTALYKGFAPILLRKLVWCSVFFVTLEQVNLYLTAAKTKA